MPMIVQEGRPPMPVLYEGWAQWRDTRGDELPRAPIAPVRASFCATCWGQGRMLSPAANGEGLVPTACRTCAGAGVHRRDPR